MERVVESPGRSGVVRWLIAAALVVAALAARWALAPLLNDQTPYVFFAVAALLAAWYGGLFPGIAAAVVGGILAKLFFVEPRNTWAFTSAAQVISLTSYLCVSLVGVLICESLHRARRRADMLALHSEANTENLRREIDSRAAVEEQLRQSERRYRFLAEAIPQIVWTARPDGVTNYNNQWMFKYLGTTPEQMQKSGWTPFRHPDDRARATELWKRAIKTGEPYECTYRLLRGADKTWRWHLARAIPMRDETGAVVLWFGTCTDIHDQKTAEDAMRASEQEFRAVFDLAGSGKALVDPANGRFIRVNHKLCEMTGYAADELINLTFAQITHPDDREWSTRECDRLFHGETPLYAAEKRYVRKDGQVIWVHVTVTMISDADGKPVRAAGVIQDITHRKRAEAELEASGRAKDQFLATLSHELRTPLTPVVLTLGALLEDPSLPDHVKDDLRTIERNVGLETKLIDDLLDLTRIARGKLELRPRDVDLHALLDHAVRSCCGADVAGKQLRVELELRAVGARVRADPLRLDQVFFNLLRNAVKFTPPGGSIRVSSASPRDGWILVNVTDSGIGIEPHVLPRIFRAFEQGDPSVTRDFGGLGLGLAVSKALVDAHGGTIRAHSDGRDRGATFSVELPLAAERATTDDLVADPDDRARRNVHDELAGATAPLRILFVEDHDATQQIMTRLLRATRYDVHAAGDVGGAKRLAESHEFDLVVSDLGLPDGSGLELMRFLRQRYGLRGIALSGFGMEEDLAHSRAAGFVEHLVKPVTFGDIEAAIARVTREMRSAAGAARDDSSVTTPQS
jgi:PAS domain S-box-containing protein